MHTHLILSMGNHSVGSTKLAVRLQVTCVGSWGPGTDCTCETHAIPQRDQIEIVISIYTLGDLAQNLAGPTRAQSYLVLS